ncbi:hypothetical protein NP233_g4956 [Leucocoprinus birnbaumii]|uniref:Uncharacterized protein n=1 Tax=Leucocoprinus birnbaumii TaxID=56174 RepID=A0AAD5YSB5_9AGAR|nr:hypothetical protein NP233_g4956 [Leucocoprinus birnbaumii]
MPGIGKTPIRSPYFHSLHSQHGTTLLAPDVPPNTSAEDPPLANPPRTPHDRHKRKLYACGIAFISCELAFLILAYYILLHPIPLQNTTKAELKLLSSFTVTLTEMKAGITAVAVVWHTIASFFVKDIIAVVCSAEFITQYRRSSALEPGKSDRVSTLTSGIMDNVVHFFGNSASREFRLAFITTLVLMTVGPLGSGTVSIGSISRSLKKPISVAVVTLPYGAGPDALRQVYNDVIKQANAIVRLEGSGNILFGYNMSSDRGTDAVLIPWPNVDVEGIPAEGHLIYTSDIVRFHYECSWMPITDFSISPNMTPYNLQPYRYRFESSNNVTYFSKLLKSGEEPQGCGVTQLSLGPDSDINIYDRIQRTAFLLYNQYAIDLGGSLWNFIFQGSRLLLSEIDEAFFVVVSPPNKTSGDWGMGMNVAILDCDPHATVETAAVTLSQNSLVIKQSRLGINGSALIGNIARRNPLPSYPLTLALDSEGFSSTSGEPTKLVKDLFLRSRGAQWLPLDDAIVELEPLPLDEVSRKMSQYARSASKAFLDGSSIVRNGTALEQLSLNQTAEVFFPVAALVASKPFLISFTIVITVIIGVFILLMWEIKDEELRTFDLRSLIDLLETK